MRKIVGGTHMSYEKANTKYGFIGLRGTRDCRDLAEKGVIQVNHDEKVARYANWNVK